MNRKYILVTVVALVVLISLCYLYFHKIKETCGEVIAINIQKYFISTDKCSWTLNPIFCCSRKKHSSYNNFFSSFYILIIYICQNDLLLQYFSLLYFLSISSRFGSLSKIDFEIGVPSVIVPGIKYRQMS